MDGRPGHRFQSSRDQPDRVGAASTRAGQQSLADVSVFTEWLTASDQGQTHLANLLATRFRGEFKVAFRAWEATSPLTNPSVPPTPFAMPIYQSVENHRAGELQALAAQQFRAATTANQRSDNYVLLTVLFAMALFFGAICTRFASLIIQVWLLGLAILIFLVAIVISATFPVML